MAPGDGQGRQPDITRAEARRWLLLDFGDWKADREDICTMAGLDPDAVRAEAVKRLEVARIEDAERHKTEARKIDLAFEALVAREDELTKRQITILVRNLAEREAYL